MKKLPAVFFLVAIFVTTLAAPAFASRVVIREIYYNAPGTDDGKNLNGEWIQLRNTSTSDVAVNNWTVRDAAGHVYTFGTYTLKAGASVKIHTGKGTNNSTDRYWDQGWYVWNNDKDTGTLKDAKGNTLDTCSYDNASASYKMC